MMKKRTLFTLTMCVKTHRFVIHQTTTNLLYAHNINARTHPLTHKRMYLCTHTDTNTDIPTLIHSKTKEKEREGALIPTYTHTHTLALIHTYTRMHTYIHAHTREVAEWRKRERDV